MKKGLMKLLYMMIVAGMCNFAFTDKAKANWTLNIGYQNPPGSSFGLNFLKFAGNWASNLESADFQQNSVVEMEGLM